MASCHLGQSERLRASWYVGSIPSALAMTVAIAKSSTVNPAASGVSGMPLGRRLVP